MNDQISIAARLLGAPADPPFPAFFRLGALPIMICVLKEERQYGVGVSIASVKWWNEERAKQGSLESAKRAIARRLERKRAEEEAEDL